MLMLQVSSILTHRHRPVNTLILSTEQRLAAALAQWKSAVIPELKGVPFEKVLLTPTPENITLQPLYTRRDMIGLPDLNTLPGRAPFLRSARLASASRHWEVAQEIGASDPVEFNAALRNALMHGQDSVVLTPDRSDWSEIDRRDRNEDEGRAELSLTTVRDFEFALQGVDLTAVPVHLDAGAMPSGLASLYMAHARMRHVPWDQLRGSVTGDPLGVAAKTGMIPVEIKDEYDDLAAWTKWSFAWAPRLSTVGVNLIDWENAGATATQQLGFGLATAVEYLRALHGRGLPLPVVASRIRFSLAVGPRFFFEIAKLRALRPLWARVLSAFDVDPALAGKAQISASTALWNKSVLDPHTNLLRVTTEAFSAVLGGCDSLHIGAFDELGNAWSESGRRVARNLHILLAEEFGAACCSDPAGGSWCVESLTHDIATHAWGIFQDIERQGGMRAALKNDYIQSLVKESADDRARAIATGKRSLTGINVYPNPKEKAPGVVAKSVPKKAKRRSNYCQFSVVPERVDIENRFAHAVEGAANGQCLAQLYRQFHRTPVEYFAITAVHPTRAAADYESLRRDVEEFAVRTGKKPQVFLAKLGTPAQYKARADFSSGFFAIGGFEVVNQDSYETPESAAQAALTSGARVAVLCATDEMYANAAPVFAQTVRAVDAAIVLVLAGLPNDPNVVRSYRAAGFDEFIHFRANRPETLRYVLKQMGGQS